MNPPGNKISLCGKRVSEAGAGFAAARLLRLLVRLEEPGVVLCGMIWFCIFDSFVLFDMYGMCGIFWYGWRSQVWNGMVLFGIICFGFDKVGISDNVYRETQNRRNSGNLVWPLKLSFVAWADPTGWLLRTWKASGTRTSHFWRASTTTRLIYRVIFSLVPPLKFLSTDNLIYTWLGVSRPIYVSVDSPNPCFPYFLGGYQWKKSPCI